MSGNAAKLVLQKPIVGGWLVFSYRKLSAKEQLKINLKGYILAVVLYFLPSLGWDLGLSGRFLTAAVFLGPLYIIYQFIRVVRGR
ncbi:hypothetical protein DL239_10090 [Sedimentitalea sp. CY04]|uniref:Uncharacterized protein n=1 Tax=Parasedimentitalea denitrificans TaxID=2211118 RepID=A0ABX0W7T1_9RHOB|nr:hypothetical protein [Sedimentitalea sp. CY04]